jgi:hypothetical protein
MIPAKGSIEPNGARQMIRQRAIAVLFLLAGSSTLAIPVSAAPPCGPEWSVVHSPSVRGEKNGLGGIDALAPNDAWAVGSHGDDNGRRPLVEHWDGTSWTEVPSPTVAARPFNGLGRVSFDTPDDGWAVGRSGKQLFEGASQALVEHWDGTSWSVVPTPKPPYHPPADFPTLRLDSELDDVAAIAPNDAWAVGRGDVHDKHGGYYQSVPLIEHWDGTEWTIVKAPHSSRRDSADLVGIAAVGPTDVWAVGDFLDRTSYRDRAFALHYDGSSWTQVDTSGSPKLSGLDGVTAISATDVWAVGVRDHAKTLAMHWDGTNWSVVPTPSPQGDHAGVVLQDAAFLSASEGWAVGFLFPVVKPYAERVVVERWDGSSWTVEDARNIGTANNYLLGIDALPSGEVWSVGVHAYRTLVETRCG